MHSSKKLLAGVGLVSLLAGLFAGCSKEDPNDALPGGNPFSPAKSQPGATVQAAPPFNKAYIATSPFGLCEGPPFVSYDGVIGYFNPSNASGATLFDNSLCGYTGIAESPNNNTIYVTRQVGSLTKLYKINPSTGVPVFLSNLWVNQMLGQNLSVNEIEFDYNGNLYILSSDSDRPLYKIAWSTVQTPPADIDVTLVGNMWGLHRDQYKQSLCVNGSTLYLVAETSPTSGACVYTVNTGTAALTFTGNAFAIPNAFTNNISSYYYNGNIYVMRDNGSGTGTIYQTVNPSTVNQLSNSIGLGIKHDAIYMQQFIP